MKQLLKLSIMALTLVLSQQAIAYNAGNTEETCKKPKFKSFTLPVYKSTAKLEVAPESEFSFTMPGKVDPTTLKVTAKKKKMAVKVENKNSFYLVTGKIPAEYTGKYLRIDVQVKARMGCRGSDGWLIKVSNAIPTSVPTPAPE